MAENTHLAFTITGQGTTLASIRLRDLLAILSYLETAIASTARHMGQEDEAVLTLASIRAGSAVYDLTASPSAQRAAERISSSINRHSSQLLPQQAVESLNDIHRVSIRLGKPFLINNGRFQSLIEPSIPLFLDALVAGSTSLFGQLYAVGGAKPTAKLKLGGSRLFTAEVSTQALAQELAAYLYCDVELEGDAWWHADSMELKRFRVKQIGSFDHTTNAAQAFSELAAVMPGLWDDVDPNDYINEQRSDLPQ